MIQADTNPVSPLQPGTLLSLIEPTLNSAKPEVLNFKVGGQWRHLSASEISARARAIALGLYSLGVRPGSHVGLLSENCPEWILADLGVLNCGAADVPIYATQAPQQVGYILKDAGAELLFISGEAQFQRVRDALLEVPNLKQIIAFNPFPTEDPRVISLADLVAKGQQLDRLQPELFDSLRSAIRPDQLATLIYTSGTTGEPKGVMLTHSNIVSNVPVVADTLDISSDDTALSFLPFSHIFERATIYLDLYLGIRIYLAESIDTVAANLAEVSPHFMTSVPRLYEKIYAKTVETAEAAGSAKAAIVHWAIDVAKEWAEAISSGAPVPWLLHCKRTFAVKLVFSKWQAALGGRIKILASGGAPLSLEILKVFIGAGLPIYEGYGLTESSPVISSNNFRSWRAGSVGKPISGVTVKIAEDGEILCTGPNIMQGYLNKPEATAEALSKDEQGRIWLHTGDIGHFDSDGFLYITDRKKDLLKTSGGKYIAPQPIENDIKQSRFVNQVVVIGDNRKFPAALIVPQMDVLENYATLKEIRYSNPAELLRDPHIIDLFERQVEKYTAHLGKYEKLKGIVLLEKELTIDNGELTPTLKVKRRVVINRYKDQIDRMYEEKEKAYGKAQ